MRTVLAHVCALPQPQKTRCNGPKDMENRTMKNKNNILRCFAAIEIDEECRAALGEALGRLREFAGEQKWVAPDKMHLTLKFIGEVADERLPLISHGLRRACRETVPFTMHVEGLGAFPTDRRPKVLFAAVRERSGELERLAGKVETELAEGAAIKKDKRTFIPHITLCRMRRKNGCPGVATLAEKLDNTDFGDVNVDGLALMQSKLTRRGADYSVIERFGFQ